MAGYYPRGVLSLNMEHLSPWGNVAVHLIDTAPDWMQIDLSDGRQIWLLVLALGFRICRMASSIFGTGTTLLH